MADDIQVNIRKDLASAIIGGSKVEVTPEGNVTVYTSASVRTKPAKAGSAPRGGTHIDISEDFNTVVLNGATIERGGGHLAVSTPGVVVTKPLPVDNVTGPIVLRSHGKHEIV